jgi:hypothetical protein
MASADFLIDDEEASSVAAGGGVQTGMESTPPHSAQQTPTQVCLNMVNTSVL